MVLIDCVARLIDGVLGSDESAADESFSSDGLLNIRSIPGRAC